MSTQDELNEILATTEGYRNYDHMLEQCSGEPPYYVEFRHKMFGLILRAREDQLRAVLEDKPLTTVDSTLNYWEERIKRQLRALHSTNNSLEEK